MFLQRLRLFRPAAAMTGPGVGDMVVSECRRKADDGGLDVNKRTKGPNNEVREGYHADGDSSGRRGRS
jgi:hypothetical protein